MVELTNREKAIILEMGFLFSPQSKGIPFDLRVTVLKAMLTIRKINLDEDELKDLSHAIEGETKLAMQESFGFLHKHKDMLKHFDGFKI